MSVQNLKDSHPAYRKDYSKLEGMFDAAVEKMNQKRIIYYASNRIISDDSRKQMLLETYKTFAWASPVSLEDIHTEIRKLAQKNKLLPISETLMNDESSLVSFFEIAGELNKDNSEKKINKSLSEDETIPVQDSESSFKNTAQELEELPSLNLKENKINTKESENRTEKFLNQYYLLKEAALNKHGTKVEEETDDEDDDLLLNNELFKNSLEEITLQDEPIQNEVISEEEERIKMAPLPVSHPDNDDLYTQLLNLSGKEQDKNDLFTLVESIQEDNNFYKSENENVSESNLAEIVNSDSFDSKEDNDLLINLDLDSNKINLTDSNIEENTPLDKEDLDIFTSEKITEVEIEPENNELVIKEENIFYKNPKRRVSLSDEKTSQSFFEEEKENIDDLYSVNKKIKGAEKDYLTSKILFIVSLVLTGIYVFLMFRSFYSYDYIALILLVIGVFLAWDLNSKNLTYTTIGILVVVAGCFIYTSYQNGMFNDYTHLVWFLLILLAISSSYQFIQNRKLLSHLLRKQKKLERHNHINSKRKISTPENKSVFISTEE